MLNRHAGFHLQARPALSVVPRLLFPILFVLFGSASPQLDSHYVQPPDPEIGSAAAFSPFLAFVNGGFDILRNNFESRTLPKIDYGAGARNVRDNLLHSPAVIRDFNRTQGHNFWREQVFPLEFNKDYMPWVPNYTLHLFGEGLVCRQTAEWFADRGIPHPYALAVLNTALFQTLNEIVENSFRPGYTVDPIADILIFNPAGWVLFYFDGPARFFGKTLHFANWSLQPMINPATGALANTGEQFIIKADLPWSKKIQPFYGWGINGTLGLSYKAGSGLNYSAGCGLKARKLKATYENRQNVVTPVLEPDMVFYIDRTESLLFALNQTGVHEINLIANLYGGWVTPRHVGVYLGLNTYLGINFGITYDWSPVGLFLGK